MRTPTANELYFGNAPPDPTTLEAMERAFFRNVRLPNGTLKSTWHHRFDDLNALVMRHLPTKRPLDVMDVAVSSGVSTLEWLESMQDAGIECRMTAGDAVVDAYLVSVGEKLRVLVTRRGQPLQYDVAGTGVMVPLRKQDRLIYFLPAMVLRAAARLVAPALANNNASHHLGIHWRALKLVSSVSPGQRRARCCRGRHSSEQSLCALFRRGSRLQHYYSPIFRPVHTSANAD